MKNLMQIAGVETFTRPAISSARTLRQGIFALFVSLSVCLFAQGISLQITGQNGGLPVPTYYVDYEGGNNLADGRSPQTAWKHSPGDSKAAGIPAAVKLLPGDVIQFKGGVQYAGEISLKVSGSAGNPIILDGNSDGRFGSGPAILDGSRMITNWQRVASADYVQGNPRWNEIVYADLDVNLSSNFNQTGFVSHRDAGVLLQAPWQSVFLIDGERRVLPIAQRPKPSDSFYPDLPADFYNSPYRITDNYPHQIYYEPGTKGNSSLPLLAITYGGSAPVIEPFNGGAVSVEMNTPATVSEMGFTLFRPASTPAPEHILFLVDGKEAFKAPVNTNDTKMQRFALPEPVTGRKLTFQLLHSGTNLPTWTKFQQIAAFTPEGTNLIQHDISSVIRDDERLTQTEADWYDGMFVAAHGGNNHVYFGRIRQFDPASHTLRVPYFSATTYATTSYAIYNTPRLIELPGEWCLQPLAGGRTRVFLLPERLEAGWPVGIGYPVLKTAVTIESGVSHIEVRGFLIQRYSGGSGGVATRGSGTSRASNIRIADCEVRFMSGQSGISLNSSDYVTVENCYVHHCPGWTVGIYVNRVNNYRILGNRLDKNSGSGIRHYESKLGVLANNAVLDHYGMHSSALNFYEGCSNIVFESNYVQNVIAINRSAENLTFRNNVVDSENRTAVSVALWMTGTVGGTFIKNILFENNTFVSSDPQESWASSIYVQSGASAPEGMAVRNNILDRLRPTPPGIIEGNIFTREIAPGVSNVLANPADLFIDSAKGDFRRKPGGSRMDAGANIPPPPAEWTR